MSEEIRSDLLKRFNILKTDRSSIEAEWEAIAKYIAPGHGRFYDESASEHSIDWRQRRDVYDATALVASRRLINTLHGSLTSPTIRWFDIKYRGDKLKNDPAAKKWLQVAVEKIYQELMDSNFDAEILKAYRDLICFGTAVITCAEAPAPAGEWDGLLFNSVPLKEAYFEQDYRGRILRFYRPLQWNAHKIVSMFGRDKVPKAVLDAEEKDPTTKLDVLYCIYPRNNKVVGPDVKLAPSRRPWAHCYMLKDTGEVLGKEDGYYEMPAFVGRWESVNDSQWGHSLGMDALPDVLSLNQCVADNLRAKQKLNDPPLMAEEGAFFTDVYTDPSTVTVVRDVNGVKELTTRASLQSQELTEEHFRSNIREIFLMDVLDIPENRPPQKTATEIIEYRERRLRNMSSNTANIRTELLNKIIERTMMVMMRNGQIEPYPEAVAQGGANIDVVYLGAFTRAQQMDEVSAIERTLSVAAAYAGVYPEARHAVDAVEAIQQIGDKLNAPASIVRSDDQVKKLVDEEKAMQREVAVQAAREQAGKADKLQAETDRIDREAQQ